MSNLESITEIHTKLKNFVSDNSEKDILETLDEVSSLKISFEILKTTEIGKTIGKLRKHNNTQIKTTSDKIVIAWKNVIISPSAIKKIKTETEKSPSSTEKSPSSTENLSSPTEKIPSTIEKKKSNNSEKKSTPEKSSVFSNEDTFRKKNAKMINEALLSKCGNDYNFENVAEIAEQIENEVFKANDGTGTTYRARIRTIILNLKDQKNPDFSTQILEGILEPCEVAKMPVEKMASSEMQSKRKETENWYLEASKSKQEGTTSTDMFKCGKCGSRETTYYQMQTRSADEPMTTFHQCCKCNNRWKS